MVVLATGSASISMGIIHPHWIRCYISGPGTNIYMWTFFFAVSVATTREREKQLDLPYLPLFDHHSCVYAANLGKSSVGGCSHVAHLSRRKEY